MLRSNLADLGRCGIPPFRFAGFQWPRHVATLDARSLRSRLAARKAPYSCSDYYHAPTPNANGGRGFYLGESCGLRYRTLKTGWYTRDDCDETINGLVFTLPKSRGFLAGWTLGEGMASTVTPEIYESERDAERAADSLAEYAAERERERNERFDSMNAAEALCESKESDLRDTWDEYRMAFQARHVSVRHLAKYREAMNAVSDAVSELRAARRDFADATRAYEQGE